MTTEPLATRHSSARAAGGRTASRPHTDLLAAVRGFRRALLVAPRTDPCWRRGVATELPRLCAAFTAHVELTDGPGGLYSQVVADAPRLVSQVHRLGREHATLCGALEALARRLDAPPDQVLGWGSDLLRALARHRQRGADLLHAAYAVDLGGET
ncbi:hypothetical protein HC031_18010 [Planosporangium thailandense]|uniref:Hemerythrin-like domain-containing protein n=1 Tax=Planosporangium thailandense TaxID=765197 RepID=A0ABX0Y2D7_9ACTN|nr:hypothetical protein [Planosporangium thailandense]NJC71600.1 hypothetical protein [Planosporangium thailandense]